MALIDHEQIIVREIVEQCERRLARLTSVNVHRIVLNPRAITDLRHHLEVILGTHPQPLCLKQLLFTFKLAQAGLQFSLDARNRSSHALNTCDIVRRRKDIRTRQLFQRLARDRVNTSETIDRVTKHLDAKNRFFVRRMHLDRVAAHPEFSTNKRHVVSVVLHVDQATKNRTHVVINTDTQVEQLPAVFVRGTHTVNTGNRCDDNRVSTSQQRRRRRVTQPVNLIIDRRILFDERVARRDIRLRLVIVVIGDEVLHPIIREELSHLLSQLCGKTLIGRQNQRRPLHLFDRPRNRCRFTRTSDAKQGLESMTGLYALCERRNRVWLVSRWRKLRNDLEHFLAFCGHIGTHSILDTSTTGTSGSGVDALKRSPAPGNKSSNAVFTRSQYRTSMPARPRSRPST